MGLGGLKTAWQRQTKDFSHTQADRYSSLIIDNRGVGESAKPLMRYSTSEMARDVLEVLDHIGWTEKRQLHVVGISMGGMISQELVSPLNPAPVRRGNLTSRRRLPTSHRPSSSLNALQRYRWCPRLLAFSILPVSLRIFATALTSSFPAALIISLHTSSTTYSPTSG